MKIFAFCALGCVVIFLAMGYQAGLFDDITGGSSSSASPPPERAKKGPRPHYPEALAEAARGKGAPQAAEYQKVRGPHRICILDTQGKIHEWQEKLPDDWIGDSVEATELVLVCSKNSKLMIQHIPYAGAPAISRYRFDLDVTVVVAKTGEMLIKKRFISMPRNVENVEAWELTALGGPVQFNNVFEWIVAQCPVGFPQDPSPVITKYRHN